jgi:hypothetical protein
MTSGTTITCAPVVPQRLSGILVVNRGFSARRATYAASAGAHMAIGTSALHAGELTVQPIQEVTIAIAVVVPVEMKK